MRLTKLSSNAFHETTPLRIFEFNWYPNWLLKPIKTEMRIYKIILNGLTHANQSIIE